MFKYGDLADYKTLSAKSNWSCYAFELVCFVLTNPDKEIYKMLSSTLAIANAC